MINWELIKIHFSKWSCKECGDFCPGQCGDCGDVFSYLSKNSPHISKLTEMLNTITTFNNEKNNVKEVLYTWEDYETE